MLNKKWAGGLVYSRRRQPLWFRPKSFTSGVRRGENEPQRARAFCDRRLRMVAVSARCCTCPDALSLPHIVDNCASRYTVVHDSCTRRAVLVHRRRFSAFTSAGPRVPTYVGRLSSFHPREPIFNKCTRWRRKLVRI